MSDQPASSPTDSAPAATTSSSQAGPAAAPAKGPPPAEGQKVSLDEVVQSQASALCEQWQSDSGNAAWIGILRPEYLRSRSMTSGGQIADLAGVSRDDAFVWVDDQGRPELWAKPLPKGDEAYSKYASYWNRFCRQYYGVDYAKEANGKELNIDHTFSQAVAVEKKLSHVRLMAINGPSNQRLGRTVEKQAAHREREINKTSERVKEPKPVFKATAFTMAKVTAFPDSIKLPKDRADIADPETARKLVVHITEKLKLTDSPVVRRMFTDLVLRDTTRVQTPLDKREEKMSRFGPMIYK